jgi:hypothetical protein
MGQTFSLVESGLDRDHGAEAAFDEFANKGAGFVIADLDAPALLQAAAAARARNIVLRK